MTEPHTTTIVNTLPLCDFKTLLGNCSHDGVAHYDGVMREIGSWAYMCEHHFAVFGVGLGLGRGQRLILRKGVIKMATTEEKKEALEPFKIKDDTTIEELRTMWKGAYGVVGHKVLGRILLGQSEDEALHLNGS